MLDENERLYTFLLQQADLVALIGARVYGGRDVPPKTYALSDGPCVTFRRRGGNPEYADALLRPSFQVKCYGSSEREANAVYLVLYAALNMSSTATMLHAECEVPGQDLAETETEWPFVLSFWRVLFRDEE